MPILRSSVSSRDRRDGFTLLEILIVIGIIITLSSMMVGYSQRNSKQILLATSQAKLSSLYSRAKALSIQTYFQSQATGESICGYGVYLDIDDQNNQKASIFQDINTSGGGCSVDPEDYSFDSSDDRLLGGEFNEMLLGHRGVYISDTTSDYVIFIPPAPLIQLDTTTSTESIVTITDGTVSLRVIVTEDGQIRIE